MAKQTVSKDISRGICNFCQGEFAKNKMTQHLKSCRVRLANAAKQKGEEQLLFHILVEAKYRPDYWMHLEVPAVATLADLDDFLRFIWLECCGHLSEFEIGDVSYSATPADDWGTNFGGGLSLVGGKEVVSEEDDDEDEDEEDEKIDAQEIAEAMSEQLSLEFKTDLKNVPVGEIEQKLEQLLGENVPPDLLPIMRPLLTQMAQSLHQGTLAEDLELATEELEEEEEEGGMASELGEVLEVGEKFSYVYDFGSSSTLSLRVLNEREGVLPVEDEEVAEEDEAEEDEEVEFDEDEELDEIDIFVMARNEPPKLVCHVCGQPATHVESASEYDAPAETALCAVHARQSEYPDELLPVVNSPRVGICGYTGEAEDGEWEEDDEDDEE